MKRPQTHRKVSGVKSVKPEHQASNRGPALFQRPEQSKAEIAEVNQRIKATYAAVTAAYLIRFDSPQNWQTWQGAVWEKYALYKDHVTLYAQHFSREVLPPEIARYDWNFWGGIELLKGGDQSHLEQAIDFLEADPWFFGSGYDKVHLTRYIKPHMLTPSDAMRLQNVVLHMVETRHGQEFGAYKQLAKKVDDAFLREQLTQRLSSGDADTQRRARWVLEALAQKDSMERGKKLP